MDQATHEVEPPVRSLLLTAELQDHLMSASHDLDRLHTRHRHQRIFHGERTGCAMHALNHDMRIPTINAVVSLFTFVLLAESQPLLAVVEQLNLGYI